MSPYFKTILRSIKGSFGRFAAILAIIALGVGFMCGLVQSSPSFMLTGDKFINASRMYDFRLISTIGFEEDDIGKIRALDGIVNAEGAYSADVLARISSEEGSDDQSVRIHSMTSDINILTVESGRLPSAPDEIVLDGYEFGPEVVGRTLILRNDRTKDDSSDLLYAEFTIVGTVRSPLYMNFQRGTTDIGNGQLSYFAYALPEAFDMEVFTECYLYYDTGLESYSDGYDEWADAKEDTLEDEVQAILQERFDGLIDENREDLNDGIAELEDGRSDASSDLDDAWQELSDARAELADAAEQLDDTREQLEALPVVPDSIQEEFDQAVADYEDGLDEYYDGLAEYYEGLREFDAEMTSVNMELEFMSRLIANAEAPEVYVLGRDTNVGYVAFETDADIVRGVANAFPIFFFALAALVCSTTMQRMVLDERGIIGTMRALGYTDTAITMKYVIYSGLATLMGALLGYEIGIRLFPFVIWDVYGMMYGFAELTLKESPLVFSIALGASLVCSVGVSVITALSELMQMPAELIRPKAPPAGRKILLEKITPVWKRMKFSNKVSLRNVFRFKKRMFMMLVGIAGSSALLITGFGILDSVTHVVDLQYDKITTYRLDAKIEDNKPADKAVDEIARVNELLGTDYSYAVVRSENVTHTSEEAVRDLTLFISDDPSVGDALKGFADGELMPWPGDNEIAISSKIAEKSGLQAGDMITLGYGDDGDEFTLRIAYVFENYTFHYAFMNVNTYEQVFGVRYVPTDLLLTSSDAPVTSDYDFARELVNSKYYERVDVVDVSRISFSNTMEKMNAVVILIIGCAAALALIVLFNLNNINISERVREIATIKVLGFSKMETGAYFFRENFILVFMGYVIGVPAGILLHRFVINMIDMDMVCYEMKILPVSYLYSLFLVILFSVLVDLVMRIKIGRIDMAESLKSAE